MTTYTLHKSVKLTQQSTANLCWEACARMSYLWKFPGHEQKYERLVGRWKQQNRGLSRTEMGLVFAHTLGMKTHPKPLQIIGKSPLIWCDINQEGGHASLLIGYHPKHGFISYNPGTTINFTAGSNIGKGEESAKAEEVRMGAGRIGFLSVHEFEKLFSGNAWGYFV